MLGGGESFFINTFRSPIGGQVAVAAKLPGDIFGAEGLVVRFHGPGSIWLQTRSPQDLLGWLKANLPANRD